MFWILNRGLNTVTSSFSMLNCSFSHLMTVWCWGWDGAGDIEGPDVDPIWEKMSDQSISPNAVRIKHDRSMDFL